MTQRSEKAVPTLGFLTVVEHPQGGLFGGLLVLNLAGRPLEFHCTAPVKANRAQEILYGPTLKPYLYGEQIGGALLAKLKMKTLAVCTDSEHVLSLRDQTETPVLLVQSAVPQEVAAGVGSDTPDYRLDGSHAGAGSSHFRAFKLGPFDVAVGSQHEADQGLLHSIWEEQSVDLDLSEPFTRIREAIEEAQAVGK